jgi:hypothetical protein
MGSPSPLKPHVGSGATVTVSVPEVISSASRRASRRGIGAGKAVAMGMRSACAAPFASLWRAMDAGVVVVTALCLISDDI